MMEERLLSDPVMLDLPEENAGERVVLRPYRPGDGPALFECVGEAREHLRPWLPWVDFHRTPEDSEGFARKAYSRWLLREDLTVGIWLRESGRLLGGSGLHPRDWKVPAFEIGYWVRPSEEGKGYVTEAVRLLLRLGFEELGANRIHIQCDPKNARSAAIPKRLGFTLEGTLRNQMRGPGGELRDTLVYALVPPYEPR